MPDGVSAQDDVVGAVDMVKPIESPLTQHERGPTRRKREAQQPKPSRLLVPSSIFLLRSGEVLTPDGTTRMIDKNRTHVEAFMHAQSP